MNTNDDSSAGTRSNLKAPRLTECVRAEMLEIMQSRLAALGQVTICIVDPQGQFITQPTWGHDYSRVLGTSENGSHTFARHLAALAQGTEPVPSLCFRGTTLYAAPITHEGQRLGLIVVGTRPSTQLDPATVAEVAQEYGVDPGVLIDCAARVEPWTPHHQEAVDRFADLLADMIEALYGQALEIRKQYADLSTVLGLAELLAGTRDLQEILDLTTRRIVELMPVKASALRLLDRDTGELVIQSVHNLSPAYQAKGRIILEQNPIDRAAFGGEVVYVADSRTDPRIQFPVETRAEGIVSALCASLAYRGDSVGVIRVYTGEPYTFTDADVSLLKSVGSLAAAAIINTRLYDDRRKARRIRDQIEYAGEVQRRMLPSSSPKSDHFEFAGLYYPTLELGGDLYDYVTYPGGAIGVTIADVVGKGLPAALMMASLRSALRAHVQDGATPAQIIPLLNHHMCRDTTVSEFATAVHAVFAPDGRSVTVSNAGHDPPLLLRDGQITRLGTSAFVIGVQLDEAFPAVTVPLRKGDIIVLYTDGLTEARSFAGEQYGKQRLRQSLALRRDLPIQPLARQLLWDVRRFVGLAEQTDDITIVAVRVR